MTTPQPQWAPDIDVSLALATRLIFAQFPMFREKSVEPFGHGWDNAAYLVDGSVLFRFPRRNVAGTLIEREAAVLPFIAPLLSLPISAPSLVGAKSEEYPWVFAAYELLAGATSCSTEISVPSRVALAEPLARFLRSLHAVDVAPLVAKGLPQDEIGRLDFEKRVRATRQRLPLLVEAGVESGASALGWMEAHPPVTLDEGERTIVHGDLYARHILVDGDGRATGVIDWGDVHLGDPALDIAIAHLMLPSSAHAAFRKAYGSVDDRTWEAARFRASYHAILEIEYGIREGDDGMRDSGKLALDFMN